MKTVEKSKPLFGKIANITLILSVISLIIGFEGNLEVLYRSIFASVPLLIISVVSRIIMLCKHSEERNWKQFILMAITILLLYYLLSQKYTLPV